MTFHHPTIKRKLTWLSALVSAIALLLAGCGFIGYYAATTWRSLAASIPVRADIVGRNSISAIRFDDAADAAGTLAALGGDESFLAAAIYSTDGRLFASYPSDGSQASIARQIAPMPSGVSRFTGRMLEVYRPIVSDGERLGTVYVSYSVNTLRQDLTRFLEIGLLVLPLSVLAAVPVSLRMYRGFSDPIARLAATAKEVSRTRDYSLRVDPLARRDELGELVDTFNTMLGEIQARDSEVEAARGQIDKSEKNYRLLFASNPHPMWVYDLETLRFLDVNDMAVSHYGFSRDEFLAMTIKDIRPAAELPALLDNVSRLAPVVEVSGVWKHRTKTGSVIDVEISSHELVLDGRSARVVLAHNVTDRLRAERALRDSEALFRGMAETMPHVVWTARPDGEREYYNRRWFDYTGLDIDATRGSGWQSAIHPDDRQGTIAQWRRAVQTGGAYEVTFRLRRRDGAFRWHGGRAAPLHNDGGQIVMWVGTITDVDDARRDREMLETLNAELEQRVRARTADLEAANSELESFSYSVSHDLRAPLRHVQGYVEMLAASAGEQLSDKSRRYLNTISEATVEMGDLIDGLLAFSRMGRVQMTEVRVPLDALVRDVIGGLEIATRGRRITWKVAPLPVTAGDPSMLKQVFANLIGNAVKYTGQREQADIEVGCAGEEDGRAVLFVRDNGAGFDMRYAHKLFGVFQRLHRAEEFEGTGIGLATVRRIVTRHGGRTWAEGTLNEGATFYFTLQAAKPEHQS